MKTWIEIRKAAAFSKLWNNVYQRDGRVKKTTAAATTHFFYDGWNLVREVEVRGAETNVVEYFWGKDISGSFQGAGGVGGLIYEKRSGAIYIPYQDAFGNIVGYWDTNGVIVAEYTYDAFGKTIAQSGAMADVFRHRFSTKYYDSETGFYYYGYRYYFPELRRWLSRDPLEEDGGENLYVILNNNCLNDVDVVGERGLEKPEPWIPHTTTWSEHHSWNCSEWSTLSNQKSGGRKDGYIEHFQRYSFKNRGIPDSVIAGFAYSIPNVLGMDSNVSSCWCLTFRITVFRRKHKGTFQYKAELYVQSLDEHPNCCEKHGKRHTNIEKKTFDIGPY